jgi:Glycosyltransferase WbsX
MTVTRRPTTIAFYLPQFYPIPQNNGWYGSGFTEWHNVVQARPLFAGHYQPHLPRELGFYDLRVPEVREAQARLARTHGIDAFCYYHYWFEGQRPLRRVVDEAIEHGIPDIPFCLAWANENWSRGWDAADHEVLLRQRYSDEDDEAHGRFLLKAMSSPRYLKVQGRPILFIYRLQSLPDPARTIQRWRQLWRAGGVDEVHVIKFETRGDYWEPARYGADSAAQFIPHGLGERVPRIALPDCHPDNVIVDYAEVARRYQAEPAPGWPRHECIAPGWDNSPRRGDGHSLLLHASTPELYEEWLRTVRERTPDDGLILINAWNEWAEGAHLEPDLRHGDAYLKATARALDRPVDQQEPAPPTPLSRVPFTLRDRFAELYLDALETETVLQRRLSRLEATFERQLSAARADAEAEAAEVRGHAADLVRENDRLRHELALVRGAAMNGHPAGVA